MILLIILILISIFLLFLTCKTKTQKNNYHLKITFHIKHCKPCTLAALIGSTTKNIPDISSVHGFATKNILLITTKAFI